MKHVIHKISNILFQVWFYSISCTIIKILSFVYSEDSNARLALQKQAVQNAVANQDGVCSTTQALSEQQAQVT